MKEVNANPNPIGSRTFVGDYLVLRDKISVVSKLTLRETDMGTHRYGFYIIVEGHKLAIDRTNNGPGIEWVEKQRKDLLEELGWDDSEAEDA